MKNFAIFFSIATLLLVGTLVYAQIYRNQTIPQTAPTYTPPKGEVLGTQTEKQISKNNTPINIKIDKNPVFLYWPQKITIETTPATEVRLKVTYPNGSINNSGTASGFSNDKGIYEVKWTISGKKDILGQAKVEVSVGSFGSYATAESIFDITTSQKITPAPTAVPTPTPAPNLQPEAEIPPTNTLPAAP